MINTCCLQRSLGEFFALLWSWREEDMVYTCVIHQTLGEGFRLLPMLDVGVPHPQLLSAHSSRTRLGLAIMELRTILLGPTGVPWPLHRPIRVPDAHVATHRQQGHEGFVCVSVLLPSLVVLLLRPHHLQQQPVITCQCVLE